MILRHLSLRRTPSESCHATLVYPDVHRCTLASKAPLSGHGVCPLSQCLSNAHA